MRAWQIAARDDNGHGGQPCSSSQAARENHEPECEKPLLPTRSMGPSCSPHTLINYSNHSDITRGPMGSCSSIPDVPPDTQVRTENAQPRSVAVEVPTPPIPLVPEQSSSTSHGRAPPPPQPTQGPTHERRMAPHHSELIQRASSSPDPSQPLQSLDELVAQSSRIQRSQSVQAHHLNNRTNFTKPGENISWRGYRPSLTAS